jgi:putative hydrolase of HD superfamily
MPTLEALLDLIPLDHMPRTGWVVRGIPEPESVAGHILGASHLAMALAPKIDPPVDLGRLLCLILVHDAPEASCGDLPRPAANHLPPGAKATMERGVAQELLGSISEDALSAWEEFEAGETREARLGKLCDQLQLGVQLVAYRRLGYGGLEEFEGGLRSMNASEFPPAAALQQDILEALASLA